MGDGEDDARHPKKFYSLNRLKHPVYTRPIPKRQAYYQEEDDDDEEDDEEMEDCSEANEEEDDEPQPQAYDRNFNPNEGLGRYPKRQKVRKSESEYEFAGTSDTKLAYDWTEHEAFVLLEVWGDRFLQLGRRSLRSEDWNEVSEKVSEELRGEKSESQCMRMMDSLKRKYKKEKLKMEKTGLNSSKWPFFNKMDMLMGTSARQDSGLACGVDSGEFVFMNTRVYLDRSNGFDEMMDSPGDSESEDDGDEKDDVDRSKKVKDYKMLAQSVNRFGKIYEKIEKSKREQMSELEKMRVEFQRELELQKKQILERAEVEIAKMQEEEDDDEEEEDAEETDADSADNLSE